MSTDTTAALNPDNLAIRRDNWRMVGKLVVVVAAMFAFGYALVPVYRTICTALGTTLPAFVKALEKQLATRDTRK